MPKKRKSIRPKAAGKPYCFVCYSTKEAHVKLFIECLSIVFDTHFEVKETPSALESGASQRDQITSLIEHSKFTVVVLDGLRPNVVFEYGIAHAKGRPVLLFKEKGAMVDIASFFRSPVELGVTAAPLDLDSQFSDVKDVNFATWNRYSIKETVKAIWDEYRKKRGVIAGYVEIEVPKICR